MGSVTVPSSSLPREILVVGGGVAGLACAISLSKELSPLQPDTQICVFERQACLETSGGAISITPIAQNLLGNLGVLAELEKLGAKAGIEVGCIELFSLRSGRALGLVKFTDSEGHGYGCYKARRVMRASLSAAMSAVIDKLPNVRILYNKKLIGGVEEDREDGGGRVTLRFDDGSMATGDLVLGCDGVHSATRSQIVDPANLAEYTGISFIQSTLDSAVIRSKFHFQTTAMNLSRQGSLLTTFCDKESKELFVAAIVRVSQDLVEQHQAHAGMYSESQNESMASSLRYMLRERVRQCKLPCIHEIIDKTVNWTLYPVYQVQPGGKWHTNRILLLGDAAHAMPPRDESSALALEDAIQFSRILAQFQGQPLIDSFRAYDELRRGLMNRGFDASRKLWQEDHDKGLLPNQIRELMAPAYLRLERGKAGSSKEDFGAIRALVPAPTHESSSDLSMYSLTKLLDFEE